MKFTIALADLESLLKTVLSRPRKDDVLILSAFSARVFIECKGDGAGIDATVFSDGTVTFLAQKFRDLLKPYKGTRFLTFEWGADGLHVQKFRTPVLGDNLRRTPRSTSPRLPPTPVPRPSP